MAIKATCPYCGSKVSAPDDYAGKRQDCRRCGRRFVIRSEEELARAAEEDRRERKRREEDLAKIEFLEKLSGTAERGRPYYETFQTGDGAVRHFHPAAPSRHLGLRALADLLVIAAYTEALLCAAGLGLCVYLWSVDVIQGVPLLLTAITAWCVVGVALFVLLKCGSEVLALLADVGDRQRDVVQLLLDVRDNTDSVEHVDPVGRAGASSP